MGDAPRFLTAPTPARLLKAVRPGVVQAVLTWPCPDIEGDVVDPAGCDFAPFEATGRVVDFTKGDIDGNGQYDALSDGVLLLRHLFGGFEGDDLINGAVATNAPRNLTEINTYLQTSIERGYFDIDGNGVVDALSDGIIAMRHLFGGFEGNTLIDGAMSPDATRDLAGVQSYLNTLTIL